MNRIAPLCLAAMSACAPHSGRTVRLQANEVPSAGRDLVIDFQSGFQSNPVELRLDGHSVFAAILTTDDRVGLARSINLDVHDSTRVDAEIVIDHSAHYSFQILLDRGRHVGFLRDLDSGKLRMDQRLEAFVYD